MKKLSFLIPLAIGVIACGILASCEKDDPVIVNDNQQTSSSTSTYTPQSAGYADSEANDPDGTIWYNVSEAHPMELPCGSRTIELRWYNPTDFYVYDYYYSPEIVRVGKVAGLTKIDINNIPTIGWATSSACEPGYAYIARMTMTYSNQTFHVAIYVVDHIYSGDGIIGAKIKCCPFSPGEGWNK